jgi:cytochrome c-type biogenesis protein CcmE
LETAQTASSQHHVGRTARRNRTIIGALIIVAVLSWLVYQNVRSSSTYYRTVQDVRTAGATQRLVRISGVVAPDSINWQAEQLILSFTIQDDTGQMPIVYHGVRPDMFQDEAQAVVEGRYGPDGVFQAKALLLKCPSKYQEKK